MQDISQGKHSNIQVMLVINKKYILFKSIYFYVLQNIFDLSNNEF